MTGVTGEPTDTMIGEGVRMYNEETGCDFCIGIGGGSPLDSAKAIGAMITIPGRSRIITEKPYTEPPPPVVTSPHHGGHRFRSHEVYDYHRYGKKY